MKTHLIRPLNIFLFLLSMSLLISGCAFKFIKRSKNITYLPADISNRKSSQKLNIFAPANHPSPSDVFIFIYGGSWNSGNKGIYSFLGTRMARKGILTVIADYPKSPGSNYDDMAKDVAAAVKWVKENISRYGGNPGRIFISGHSAGGHLAALVAIKKEYSKLTGAGKPLKGVILIDAAGLDMYGYLRSENFDESNTYIKTFTNDPIIWKAASPIFHLHDSMPPMLIYRGEKTYPSIEESNEKFIDSLKAFTVPNYHILKGKKHVPMILQFFNSANPRYKEIIGFMKAQQ